MNDEENPNPPVERLAIGREIVAPEHLWGRIASAAESSASASSPLAWPTRIAAVAAGAILFVGVAQVVDRTRPRSALPDSSSAAQLSEHFVLAASYFETGKLEERQLAALDARPEILLIRATSSAVETPR